MRLILILLHLLIISMDLSVHNAVERT